MNLSPSQERAVAALRHDWPDTESFVLWAPYGLGRSTMLRAVQKERGGIVLDMAAYLDRLADAEPLALEETLHKMLISALRENEVVLVDDLHLLNSVVCCNSFYPKKDFLNAPLEVAAAFAREKGRKLVFTMPSSMPQPIAGRAHFQGYKRLDPADFRFFFDLHLGADGDQLDVAKIHRFAPKLNLHQIRLASLELRRKGKPSTGGIGLLTPHDVHYGLADQRVAARARVLATAHAAHPERFPAGVPTPPPPPTAVWINPPTLAPIDAEETH